jgi:hypothetical protein
VAAESRPLAAGRSVALLGSSGPYRETRARRGGDRTRARARARAGPGVGRSRGTREGGLEMKVWTDLTEEQRERYRERARKRAQEQERVRRLNDDPRKNFMATRESLVTIGAASKSIEQKVEKIQFDESQLDDLERGATEMLGKLQELATAIKQKRAKGSHLRVLD